MGNEANKKFTWVSKKFSNTWQTSDIFVVDRCNWQLVAAYKGDYNDSSLFLDVYGYASLPCEWRRRAKFRLSVINQLSEDRSKVHEAEEWFDQESPGWGFYKMLPLTKFQATADGFITNGGVKIVVEVDVLEVIGGFDVPEEAENSTQPLTKKMKLNVSSDLRNKKHQLNEVVDVNGFKIFPPQVKNVRRIFEKFPDFTSKFRSKNQHLKSTYMNVLLGVIETLCQSPQELSDDGLDEASAALSYVAKGGFEVDWLEKKLEEVKEKKKEVDIRMALMQQKEEELETLNQKCLDLRALVKKQNADLSASNVALSFNDVV